MKDPAGGAELKYVTRSPDEPNGHDSKSGEALRASLEKQLEHVPFRHDPEPPVISDHELVQRIGGGAYGEVWLARNTLGTLRAVKVIYRAQFEDTRPYEREFKGILRYEPISRTHPGLTAVLHAGRNEAAGYFYYVMELADNELTVDPAVGVSPAAGVGDKNPGSYRPRTLRSAMSRAERMSPVAAARLALQLAEALDHLHQHGLIHRDIKRGNVIFVGGKPKLADIGLVSGTGDTRSFVGTEGFIPPEGPGSVQADIFALGKLLYELITGRDRLEFPQFPSGILNSPERDALLDLNEVVTKACARKPHDRYQTATELVADLNLFLAGQSLRQVRTLAQRLRWVKYSAGIAGTLLVLAGLALWWARDSEAQARRQALVESGLRARAEAAEQSARRQLYWALLEQARATVRSGEMGQRMKALDAIRRAAAISNSVDLSREALTALALPDLRPMRSFSNPPGTTLLEMGPRFERYAIAKGAGPVEIRSVADQHVLATLPASAPLRPYFAAWSPDGRFLAVRRDYPGGESRANLELWDTISGEGHGVGLESEKAGNGPRQVLLLTNALYGVATFHPRKPDVLLSRADETVMDWDLERGTEVRRLQLGQAPALLAYSPNGERLAAAFEGKTGWTVAVCRAADAIRLWSRTFPGQIGALEWEPGGHSLAVADYSGAVSLIDAQTGEVHQLGRHKFQAVSCTFSLDGRYLFTGGWERELICWDLWTMERAFNISLESFRLQIGPDGACAILSPGRVQICSLELPEGMRSFPERLGGRLRRAAFSPDGRWLAVPGQDRLGVWDLRTNQPGALLSEGADSRVYFSPDSGKLFASRDDGCHGWELHPRSDLRNAPELTPLSITNPQGFTSMCLSSNRAVVTCPSGSRVVSLDRLDAEAGPWVPTITGVNGASPDGRLLAIFTPYSRALWVYGLPSITSLAVLTNFSSVREFQFLSGSREIAVASNTGVEIWSTTNWHRLRRMTNAIDALFAPTGDTCWLTKGFRNAGLYQTTPLKPLLLLPTSALPLALSPDGRFLALSRQALRLQVWDLPRIRAELASLGLSFNSS